LFVISWPSCIISSSLFFLASWTSCICQCLFCLLCLEQMYPSQSLIISFSLTHSHIWYKHQSSNTFNLVYLSFVCAFARWRFIVRVVVGVWNNGTMVTWTCMLKWNTMMKNMTSITRCNLWLCLMSIWHGEF
jgi:hypothetical protein